MCAPSAPSPAATAQAQTVSNKETAVAQSYLNNTNQITPYGNLTYAKTGEYNGIPQFTATQTLSPQGQKLLETSQGTQQNLANLAQQQSGRLAGLLNTNLNFDSLPAAGAAPSYQSFGNGPSLTTQGGSTSGIQTGYGSGGDITRQIANAGTIQTSLGSNDFSGDRRRVEDALFSRLNPQLDRDRQQFETSLVNRGIRPGSDAYAAEMNRFQQGINDQRTSILLQGGTEQSRLQGMALNAGNFANSAQNQQYGQNANNAQFANQAQALAEGQNAARAQFGNSAQQQLYTQQLGNNSFSNAAQQQMYANMTGAQTANNALQDQQFANSNTARQNALNEMMLQRQQPLNEILALAGQSQLQQPSFTNTPQTGLAGTDVAGITQNAYGQQMQQYQQNQGLLGGLFSAGANLLALSDRRAKTDIKRIGQTDGGVPVYQFRYRHGGPAQIGYMAQDLLKTHPEAVSIGPDGFYRVDYEKVA